MILFWIVTGICVAGLAYIRLAPSEVARWHVPLSITEDADMATGAQRILETGPGGLAQFDQIARDTPYTTVLAGSVDDDMVTYITRSRVFGFPDYTTAQQDGDVLKLYGRLRFGKSDVGVNRARLEQWGRAITGGTD
ncbi:MAG: DUF1499 domain-containing protein [Paracoccaceae bacterium]